jgi:Tfp pilus assembly protein PilN
VINLLPPEIKTQINYAQRNARLLGILARVALAFTAMVTLLIAGHFWLAGRTARANQELQAAQARVKRSSDILGLAAEANARLVAAVGIRHNQNHFAALTRDLAAVLPPGCSLASLQLAGDDKKPLRLAVSAPSYQVAAGVRDALMTSPRLAAADLESISGDKTKFIVNVNILFKPGQAK